MVLPLPTRENKYRTLIENIPIGIFRSTAGAKGRFIELNRALVLMLGYGSKKELSRESVASFYLHARDRGLFVKKMSRDGFVRSEVLTLRKKDRTPIVVSVTAVVVRDGRGRIVYYDGMVEDITERKKTEEELLVQKTYLEKLFNSAPEAIVLHDNNDRIANVNQEFIRMFGYTREESLGRLINDLVAPAGLEEEAAAVSQKVLGGERIELDTRRRRKDGALIDVSILGAPIIHKGRQLGDYAIYRDIARRKRAEEEVLLQKIYLEELFNSAPEAIVLHDTSDIVVNVNLEFTRLFGYSREEAIGRPINDLVAPAEYRLNAEGLSHKVIHGEPVEEDSIRRRKDGSLFDVSILGAPIIKDGVPIGVYAIYRDITEKKRSEEARIRAQEEARMAREIQLNFLPKSNPLVEGYDIVGRSIPAMHVGGDYFDFIRLDDDRLAIALGDVSGHGMAASLVMANLQATIRGQVLIDSDPATCLQRANRLLYHSTDARTFISFFYGVLDLGRNTLTYSNAGQDAPILLCCDAPPSPLPLRGIALGMKEDVRYQREEIVLHPGDRLLIYSDGITEAMNASREEFGLERLNALMAEDGRLTSQEIIDKILSAVARHLDAVGPFSADDMTMIALKRNVS